MEMQQFRKVFLILCSPYCCILMFPGLYPILKNILGLIIKTHRFYIEFETN